MAEERAWIVIAAGDDRTFSSHDGYPDVVDRSYHWDSRVPNSASLREGDIIVIRDSTQLLGASLIERVHVQPGERKLIRLCGRCGNTDVRPRIRTSDWRCYECKTTFADPEEEYIEVTKYWSDHASSWVDLQGQMSWQHLLDSAVSPKSQHAMRALDWKRFTAHLRRDPLTSAATRKLQRLHTEIAGGHRDRVVRVRRGQAGFRRLLLDRFGPLCAVTGDQPEHVLEAAHLYSFADTPEHHEEGGLLLRRDIHRLFDLGLLGFQADAGYTVTLKPELAGTAYSKFAGTPSAVTLSPKTQDWLGIHYRLHFAMS